PGACYDLDDCGMPGVCPGNFEKCIEEPGSPAHHCACMDGYERSPGGSCIDVDECAAGDACDDPVTELCVNELGSVHCECGNGYEGELGACTDVDECAPPTSCSTLDACTNEIGSFRCDPLPVDLAAGGSTACHIRDGVLSCWGDGRSGQLASPD